MLYHVFCIGSSKGGVVWVMSHTSLNFWTLCYLWSKTFQIWG